MIWRLKYERLRSKITGNTKQALFLKHHFNTGTFRQVNEYCNGLLTALRTYHKVKSRVYIARQGQGGQLGQTCLNLTFRLIQCWTFFVELGFKRIYMIRSIYKDFKKFYKTLNIYS